MKKQTGFTLIELVIFIVITGLLGAAILYAFVVSLIKSPIGTKNATADLAAQQCAEYFIGQRELNGYASISCTSPNTPSYCTTYAPSGFTVSSSCTSPTINGDSNYKSITITVTGQGNASLTLTLGSY